jgi:aspartate beta-hydroxylase
MQLTPAEIQAAAARGAAALQAGDAITARDSFAWLVAKTTVSAEVNLGLAYALQALGQIEDALTSVNAALAKEPKHIRALVLKGELLNVHGSASAASFFQAALRCASELGDQLPHHWSEAVAHAQQRCDTLATRYEAHLRSRLGALSADLGSPSARFAQSIDLLTGGKQLYVSQPRLYLFPELASVQFHDRSAFPWLAELEARTGQIRDEALALMRDATAFKPYVESDPARAALSRGGMLDNPDWSAFYLWKNGEPITSNQARCPASCAALAGIPFVHVPGRSPSVLFSLLRPGAHIPAHHGFINTRLIVHLPLIVPNGCRFRVGNEVRSWREGEAWLFDDTIEHEAWNDSAQTRVILLFEVWRPELTAQERGYVSAMFEAISDQLERVTNWAI